MRTRSTRIRGWILFGSGLVISACGGAGAPEATSTTAASVEPVASTEPSVPVAPAIPPPETFAAEVERVVCQGDPTGWSAVDPGIAEVQPCLGLTVEEFFNRLRERACGEGVTRNIETPAPHIGFIEWRRARGDGLEASYGHTIVYEGANWRFHLGPTPAECARLRAHGAYYGFFMGQSEAFHTAVTVNGATPHDLVTRPLGPQSSGMVFLWNFVDGPNEVAVTATPRLDPTQFRAEYVVGPDSAVVARAAHVIDLTRPSAFTLAITAEQTNGNMTRWQFGENSVLRNRVNMNGPGVLVSTGGGVFDTPQIDFGVIDCDDQDAAATSLSCRYTPSFATRAAMEAATTTVEYAIMRCPVRGTIRESAGRGRCERFTSIAETPSFLRGGRWASTIDMRPASTDARNVGASH